MLAFSPAHEIKNKSVGFNSIHTRPYLKMSLIRWLMAVHGTARSGDQVPFSTIEKCLYSSLAIHLKVIIINGTVGSHQFTIFMHSNARGY